MQNAFTSVLTAITPGSKRGSDSATADIRNLLLRDHEVLLSLVGKLTEARSEAARSRVLRQLASAAPAHDKPEERTVYAALKRASKESADIAHEGKVEHALISGLLKKLTRMRDLGSPKAKAHADVLKELLEHHIEEEHSEMFERLGRDFDADERAAMGAAYLAARRAFISKQGARKPARKVSSRRRAKPAR